MVLEGVIKADALLMTDVGCGQSTREINVSFVV
jgi:hypothetical protein